jgi:hypothetical protein
LLIVAVERDDLLDTHTAEHVENLGAYANRIQQITGLNGGPPEAGLRAVRAAEEHGEGLACGNGPELHPFLPLSESSCT